MRKTIMAASLMLISMSMTAQQRTGGITQQMLQEIQKAQPTAKQSKAIANALATNKIDDLAKNFAHQGAIDTQFSVETKSQSITDQKSSGRCWMFSGMNVLRSNFANRTDEVAGFTPAVGILTRLSLLLGPIGKSQSVYARCHRNSPKTDGRLARTVLL